jgi:hypothetical protein
VSTIRVALGDSFNYNYALTGPTTLYVSPTPSVEVDVIDAADGTVKATIPCTITGALNVTFPLEDATSVRSMNTLVFRVTTAASVQTYPTNGEQGLLVF